MPEPVYGKSEQESLVAQKRKEEIKQIWKAVMDFVNPKLKTFDQPLLLTILIGGSMLVVTIIIFFLLAGGETTTVSETGASQLSKITGTMAQQVEFTVSQLTSVPARCGTEVTEGRTTVKTECDYQLCVQESRFLDQNLPIRHAWWQLMKVSDGWLEQPGRTKAQVRAWCPPTTCVEYDDTTATTASGPCLMYGGPVWNTTCVLKWIPVDQVQECCVLDTDGKGYGRVMDLQVDNWIRDMAFFNDKTHIFKVCHDNPVHKLRHCDPYCQSQDGEDPMQHGATEWTHRFTPTERVTTITRKDSSAAFAEALAYSAYIEIVATLLIIVPLRLLGIVKAVDGTSTLTNSGENVKEVSAEVGAAVRDASKEAMIRQASHQSTSQASHQSVGGMSMQSARSATKGSLQSAAIAEGCEMPNVPAEAGEGVENLERELEDVKQMVLELQVQREAEAGSPIGVPGRLSLMDNARSVPVGWEEKWSKTHNQPYFKNVHTGQTAWTPEEMAGGMCRQISIQPVQHKRSSFQHRTVSPSDFNRTV